MSLFKLSAVDIVKFLKEGKYSCEEIIKSFIDQIDKNEKKVEAWEFFDKELALNQAKKFLKEYDNYKKSYNQKNHQNINEIRTIIEKYKDTAKIHLGGIPMIADDMMTYIKNDIIVFGAGVFLFIVCTLWFIFRSLAWVFIPLLSCFFSVFIMVGLLGLVGWKVTVISSNFIALMLILTMAMNIHMSVRYLQFKKENPNILNSEAILWTSKKMFWPILYTVLTTICAFLSLIFSDIKPIIDFGWMMTVGLLVSLSITFTLLPAILNILSKENTNYRDEKKSIITSFLSKVAQKNTKTIFKIFIIIVCWERFRDIKESEK